MDKLLFQEDISLVHRAKIFTDWFGEHTTEIVHIPWPAKSPDLNPIKNLYDYLEQQVKRIERLPSNLREQLMTEWLKSI